MVLAGLKGSGSGWCVCARGLLESGVGVGDGHRLMHRLKHRIVKNWKTLHRQNFASLRKSRHRPPLEWSGPSSIFSFMQQVYIKC